MKRRSYTLLFCLLAGCQQTPASPPMTSQAPIADSQTLQSATGSSSLNQSPVASPDADGLSIAQNNSDAILPGAKPGRPTGNILPGSKGEILPGTKGEILPGSKDARNLQTGIEVQIQLPDVSGFATQQLGDTAETWTASLDDRAIEARLIRRESAAGKQWLTFSFKSQAGLAPTSYHALAFYSSAGVLQSAGLVPAQEFAGPSLSAPLSSRTLAVLLVASNYAHAAALTAQDLPAVLLGELNRIPEVAELDLDLQAAYRETKGKDDPRLTTKIQLKSKDCADKLAVKIPSGQAKKAAEAEKAQSNSGNGNGSNGHGHGHG